MNKILGTLLLAICLGHLVAGEVAGQQKKKQRQERDRRARVDNAPKIGEEAPTFVLKSLDGENQTDLADFRGKKPVVLLFGSYT